MAFVFDPIQKRSVLALAEEHNFRPNKILGQNFLISAAARQKIISAADILPQDTIVEIGPGMGTLTIALAEHAGRVVAIEKDHRALDVLGDVLKKNNIRNVQIISADALKEDFFALAGNVPYKIVANLPYYLTARFFRHLFELKNLPQRVVVTIQKEVALRITEHEPNHSQLSLAVQLFSNPRVSGRVDAEAFWPEPKVDSAILVLENLHTPEKRLSDQLFALFHAGFSSKRKIFAGNMAKGFDLSPNAARQLCQECGISPTARAQEISLEQWKCLAKKIKV